MGISEKRARLKELKSKIKKCEDEKAKANSVANSLLSKYAKGQISHEEYEKELRKQLGGRDRVETIAHYNSFMRKYALEKSTLQSELRQQEKKRKMVSVAAALLMFAFLIPFLADSDIGTDALTGLLFADPLTQQNQTVAESEPAEPVVAEPEEHPQPEQELEEPETEEPEGITIRPGRSRDQEEEQISLPVEDNLTVNLTENESSIVENISLINITDNLTGNISEPEIDNISINDTELNLTPPIIPNITGNISEGITDNISINITEPIQNITINETESEPPELNITEPEINKTQPDYNETFINETEKPELNITEETPEEINLAFFVRNQTARTNTTAYLSLSSAFNRTNTTFMLINYDNLTAFVSDRFLSYRPEKEGNFSLKLLAHYDNNTYHSNIFYIFARHNATLNISIGDEHQPLDENHSLDNLSVPVFSKPIPDIEIAFGDQIEINRSVYFWSNSSLIFTYAYNFSLLSVYENSSLTIIEPIKNINATSRFRIFCSNLNQTESVAFNITLVEDAALRQLLNETEVEETAEEPNSPPEIIGSISFLSLKQNETFSIDLNTTFRDPDNDTLVFLAVSDFPVVSFVEQSELNLYASIPFEGERRVKVMAFDSINITSLEFYVNYTYSPEELNISVNITDDMNITDEDIADNISEKIFDEKLADLYKLELDQPAEWRKAIRVTNQERDWKYKTISVSIPTHAENISVSSNRQKLSLISPAVLLELHSPDSEETESDSRDYTEPGSPTQQKPENSSLENQPEIEAMHNESAINLSQGPEKESGQIQQKGFSVTEAPDSLIIHVTDFYDPFATKEIVITYYTKGIRTQSNYSIVTGLTHYKEFRLKNLDNITYYDFIIEMEEKPAHQYQIVSPTNEISFTKPTASNSIARITFNEILPYQVSSFSIYSIYDTFSLSSGSWINGSWNVSFETEFNDTLLISSHNKSEFEVKAIVCRGLREPVANNVSVEPAESKTDPESIFINETERAGNLTNSAEPQPADLAEAGEDSSEPDLSELEANSTIQHNQADNLTGSEPEPEQQDGFQTDSASVQDEPEPESKDAVSFNIFFEENEEGYIAETGQCAEMELELSVPDEDSVIRFSFMNITKNATPTETVVFTNISAELVSFCPTCSQDLGSNASFFCAKSNSGADGLGFYPVLSFNLTSIPRAYAHEAELCLDIIYSSHPNTLYAVVLEDSLAPLLFGNLSSIATRLDLPEKFVSGRPYSAIRINRTITELSPRQTYCGTIYGFELPKARNLRIIILGQDMKNRAYPFSCFLISKDTETRLSVKY